MRNALSCVLAAVLLAGPLLSQAVQPEPFGFKDDKLGMSLGDFKAMHLSPGHWESEAMVSSSVDPRRPPPGKGWKWKPDLDCKELVKAVITQCRYAATIAGGLGAGSAAMFVDGKLAVIGVSYTSPSPLVQQALVDKLGSPARLGSSNGGLSALRWDNGVSVVEFQEHYCGSGIWIGDLDRQDWSNDVAQVLRGSYCKGNDAGNYGFAFIWYVHRSLFSLTMTRWKEAIEGVERRARSEPFTFDDELGMNLDDFKARHRNPGSWKVESTAKATRTVWAPEMSSKETARAVTECDYSATVLGIKAFGRAIFAGDKLAAIHIYYVYYGSGSRLISGVLVPVDIKQALIDKFGLPEVIRGYGDSALTGDDRRSLHWDDGVTVVEYQGNNCGGGNEYEKITKILQGRYCEKGDSGDGTVSIWDIDKALFGVAIARHREAEENARKKARSDM